MLSWQRNNKCLIQPVAAIIIIIITHEREREGSCGQPAVPNDRTENASSMLYILEQ
jgi:hypothetical protein